MNLIGITVFVLICSFISQNIKSGPSRIRTDPESTISKHFGGEPKEKVDRIGPNVGVYNGVEQFTQEPSTRVEPEDLTEEDIDVEEQCPIGFIKENSIVSEFCSDVDECNNDATGCHSDKAMCQNKVGGFECKCKNEFEYGDGYECFENLNFLIIPWGEPYKYPKNVPLAHKLVISPNLFDSGVEFDISDSPHVLTDQNLIYDTSSMCAVVMNTPKGNLFLDSESPIQMFLIGGFDGETFNQWYNIHPHKGIVRMPQLPFTFNRGLCFSALPTQVLLCSSRDSTSSCYLMTQKQNGEFEFSDAYTLSTGHNEGVIGTLEYEIFNNGLSSINHPFSSKYYITAGYGQNSDVIDSAQHHLHVGLGATSWSSMSITTNSSMHYAPLNGLIWASSTTINRNFYVFGGVDSNNESEISYKVRVCF